MPKTLRLFEDYSSQISVESDDVLIALNARTAWALQSSGLPYKTLDDYYDEKKMRSDEDALFDDQQSWLLEIDSFFNKELSLPVGLRFFSIHLNRIKYIVDENIIRARVLREMLRKEQPGTVILHERFLTGIPSWSIYDFTNPSRYQWQPLLKQFQLQRSAGIFDLKIFAAKKQGHPLNKSGQKITVSIFINKIIKKLKQSAVQTPKTRNSESSQNSRSFLFLDEGTWAIDEPRRRLQQAGQTIWVKKQLKIENRTTGKQISLQFNPSGMNFDGLWKKFTAYSFLKWPNKYAGIDLEPVLEPYFEDLFLKHFPKILSEYWALQSFYKSNKIDAIISRASAGEHYPAALLAAAAAGIPRICFQHSIGPLDMSAWALDETVFSDLNFTMHPSVIPYFKNYRRQFRTGECEISSSSHYLKKIARKKTNPSTGKPLIFYVPTKLAFGANHFNMMYYTDTWYFNHQKKLFSYFASQAGFDFIYKHSEHQRWADESILPWLKSRSFKNIGVESTLFSEVIQKADAVIFDYPSTGFFEASAAGIPALALCHEAMRVNTDMIEIFGSSLQWFTSTEDAIQKFSVFLKSDKKKYLHPLSFPPEPEPLITIENFCGKFFIRAERAVG